MYGEASYAEVPYGAVPETLGVPIIPEVSLVTTSLIFVVELDLIQPQPPQPLLLTAQTRNFSLIAYPATLQADDLTLDAEAGSFTLTAVDAGLAYTAAAFTPAELSGLQFWYDMTDSTITESGGLVSQINDLSGNAQHAVQATAALRADLLANQFGSRSGLDFTSDRYACGTVPNTQAGTFFWAGIIDSGDSTDILVGRGANNDATAGVLFRSAQSPPARIQLGIGNGTTRATVNINSAYTGGQVLRCIGRWNTTSLTIRVNDLTATNAAHGMTGSWGTAGVRLGSASAGAQASELDGKIGAVGKYNRYLTDDETDQLMAYLEALYPD